MAAKEKNKQEESLFVKASTKLSDAQELTSEAHELVKQDLDSLRRERSAFEEIARILNLVHFDSTIKLNVGGKIYKTTLDTLQKDPDSMLSAMFSGRHELRKDEEDGAYFIDRDGKLFRYILNYLRHGELLFPNDRIVQRELLTEARFYQVRGLIAELERRILPLKNLTMIIKNEDHHLAISSWLPPISFCCLLYRVTTHGGDPIQFHRRCDNKGPTLVVIKSGEYICGGFTTKSWKATPVETPTADSQAFLFTLVNPSGSEPIKINATPDTSVGIRSQVQEGPNFGTDEYYDLTVNPMNTPTGLGAELDLGYGFVRPKNANSKNYFAGKSPFEVTDMEVFQLDF